jgi:hypothetical protein
MWIRKRCIWDGILFKIYRMHMLANYLKTLLVRYIFIRFVLFHINSFNHGVNHSRVAEGKTVPAK